ncbi:MAG TPA: hypothetical protein VLE93_02455 [Candidatus Saccharimonadales bacterium]|nr:hypothetical protein [Candidatus Saccharimonadales bacterium]
MHNRRQTVVSISMYGQAGVYPQAIEAIEAQLPTKIADLFNVTDSHLWHRLETKDDLGEFVFPDADLYIVVTAPFEHLEQKDGETLTATILVMADAIARENGAKAMNIQLDIAGLWAIGGVDISKARLAG